MEENITLILYYSVYLERDDNRRLEYVRGKFCVWDKSFWKQI